MEIKEGQYAISSGRWGTSAHRADVVTPKLVKTHQYGKRYAQINKDNIVAVVDDQEAANACIAELSNARKTMAAELKDASAEYDRVFEEVNEARKLAVQAVVDKWGAQ